MLKFCRKVNLKQGYHFSLVEITMGVFWLKTVKSYFVLIYKFVLKTMTQSFNKIILFI